MNILKTAKIKNTNIFFEKLNTEQYFKPVNNASHYY